MEIAAPPGFTCRYVETIGSTSDALKEAAADFAPDGTAIAAGEQTAGRGRYGRRWASPPGNLYMSLLLRDVGPLHAAAQLSFVAAVAMGEAISHLTPEGVAVRFKWPNDVLANGAKTAGVLLESGGAPGEPWVIVGTGVNLISHPEGTDFPATDLSAEGAAVAPPALAAAYLAAFARWRRRWRDQGFAPIRAAWLAAAAHLGGPVRLKLAGREPRDGRFVDLDEDGALSFEPDHGGPRERISAGEVHFPREDPADAKE
ncbi:MAG: biotin--[acetyl-CoA-carboxylase] ligase [Marivibrio sp.]|uniref:biotin--[acetyl-CoA-carboxylase] ligase n=1 Tax=Marivibrio sp. TaxID=2039719 RepID=UPI0032ED568A